MEQGGKLEQGNAEFERRVRRWFPLRFDLVSQPEFREIGYSAVCVLVDMLCELGEHLSLLRAGLRDGPFKLADGQWAFRLDLSLRTFRSARIHMGKLRWIEYNRGYRTPAGRHPTEYTGSMFALAEKGVRCAAMPRMVWARLRWSLQCDYLSAQDVATAVWLLYLWELCGGAQTKGVVLTQAATQELTGIPWRAFRASLKRLQQTENSALSFGLEHAGETMELRDLRTWYTFGSQPVEITISHR